METEHFIVAHLSGVYQREQRSSRLPYPDGPLPLTERQMEVLRCLALGMPDRAIAKQLYIEEGAVRGHISNIKKRLQLRQRWQAIDEARRHGLAELSEQ